MLKRLLHISSSPGLRSATLTTVGNVISTGLGAIAIILISRLLTPVDFGIFSAIFAMMLMVSKLGDLGTNIAFQRTLAQPTTILIPGKKITLTSAGLYLKVALSLVSLGFGLLLTPWLSHLLHLPIITYVGLGWVAMIGIIFYDYISVVTQAAGRFGLAVTGNSLQSILKIIVILTFAPLHLLTPLNLIALYGLTPLVAAFYMALVMKIRPKSLSLPEFNQVLKPIFALTQWTVLATLAASLADNVDVLMVQSILNSQATGWYAAAFRISSFAAVAYYSLGTVLNVRVAKYKTQEHLNAYLRKALLLSLFVFSGMLLASLLSPYLILYTAGVAYLPAVPTLRLLLYSTGLLMATAPFVAVFYTLDAPRYFAYSGILTAVILIGLDYLWLPAQGITGAGWAKLVTRAIVLGFTLIYARLAYQHKYARH